MNITSSNQKIARINVETGVVVTVITPYAVPDGYIEVAIPDEILVTTGWTYANGQFAEPVSDPAPDDAPTS